MSKGKPREAKMRPAEMLHNKKAKCITGKNSAVEGTYPQGLPQPVHTGCGESAEALRRGLLRQLPEAVQRRQVGPFYGTP